MAEAKETRKKRNETEKSTAKDAIAPESTEEKSYLLATGLEDYGRWKAMFKDHKRDPKEKPFRRGRIWC